MKDKIKNKRRMLYLTLTILGIALVVISVATYIYDYIKIDNSVYITAKISSLSGTKNEASVKYTVNDKEYESMISLTNGSDKGVGDEIMVRVSINKPMEHVERHTLIVLGTLFIGIILLVLTVKETKNSVLYMKKVKSLKLSGLYVLATITEVFVNSNGKKHKDVFPYKLRCRYMNPMDNNVYTFDSEDTFVNIGEVLNKYGTKWVVVYIDRVNPSNYYVDLESLIPHVNLIDPIEFMKSKPESGVENSQGENEEDKQNEPVEDKDSSKVN